LKKKGQRPHLLQTATQVETSHKGGEKNQAQPFLPPFKMKGVEGWVKEEGPGPLGSTKTEREGRECFKNQTRSALGAKKARKVKSIRGGKSGSNDKTKNVLQLGTKIPAGNGNKTVRAKWGESGPKDPLTKKCSARKETRVSGREEDKESHNKIGLKKVYAKCTKKKKRRGLGPRGSGEKRLGGEKD